MSHPSEEQVMASLPPLNVLRPDSVHDKDEVDRHNAAILEVRGYRTTAKGYQLHDLASSVLLDVVIDEPDASTSFTPFYFFFYGSLQLPRVLKCICRLSEEEYAANPLRTGAEIVGWKPMMWGPFPALVPAGENDAPAKGMVWKRENPSQVADLISYEGSAYRLAYCTITVPAADGSGGVEVIEKGRTFVSTVDGEELEEGSFDTAEYERYRFRF